MGQSLLTINVLGRLAVPFLPQIAISYVKFVGSTSPRTILEMQRRNDWRPDIKPSSVEPTVLKDFDHCASATISSHRMFRLHSRRLGLVLHERMQFSGWRRMIWLMNFLAAGHMVQSRLDFKGKQLVYAYFILFSSTFRLSRSWVGWRCLQLCIG